MLCFGNLWQPQCTKMQQNAKKNVRTTQAKTQKRNPETQKRRKIQNACFEPTKHTVGFLIHGRHARIFGQNFDQIFDQIFGQGFWPGFLDPKIQCTGLLGRRNTVLQVYRDEKIQFYSSTGTEKNERKTMY